MAFKILNAGLFSTIQDRGRYGYTHLGITTSGAMDRYAYYWSQRLLDQEINALELMVGLKLEVMVPTTIAITGADLDFRINETPMPIWQTHTVKVGDRLSFSRRKNGVRAYLAVAGGFQAPQYYGSYATTLKEGFGARCSAGEYLYYNSTSSSIPKRLSRPYLPHYPQKELCLRVVLGYQEKAFSPEAKAEFFSSIYRLTPQSDRMGYRLRGASISSTTQGIISEGIAYGAIQIPPDGQPIVLLNERQTIGGYPKIGSVIPTDCYRLAQLPLDGCVSFEPISLESAQKINRR